MRAIVEVRSQKRRGASRGFGGPDCYVAVQIVPDGVIPLATLREDSARKRGIKIEYFGSGYSQYSGPKSAYGKALAAAKERAAQVNSPSYEFVCAVLNARKRAEKEGILA